MYLLTIGFRYLISGMIILNWIIDLLARPWKRLILLTAVVS